MLNKTEGPGGGWLVKCDGCGKHIAVIPRCEILKIMGSCLVSCIPETEHIADTERTTANN